jgi:hypothetical protein
MRESEVDLLDDSRHNAHLALDKILILSFNFLDKETRQILIESLDVRIAQNVRDKEEDENELLKAYSTFLKNSLEREGV